MMSKNNILHRITHLLFSSLSQTSTSSLLFAHSLTSLTSLTHSLHSRTHFTHFTHALFLLLATHNHTRERGMQQHTHTHTHTHQSHTHTHTQTHKQDSNKMKASTVTPRPRRSRLCRLRSCRGKQRRSQTAGDFAQEVPRSASHFGAAESSGGNVQLRRL